MMRQYEESEYQQVSRALEMKEYLTLPNVPKENDFSSSRFLGRLIGFNVAALNSSRKICLYSRSYLCEKKNGGGVSSSFSYKEERAVLELMTKILSMGREDFSNEKYRLGLWEGTAILIHGEAPSLLYAEADIDINKV